MGEVEDEEVDGDRTETCGGVRYEVPVPALPGEVAEVVEAVIDETFA